MCVTIERDRGKLQRIHKIYVYTINYFIKFNVYIIYMYKYLECRRLGEDNMTNQSRGNTSLNKKKNVGGGDDGGNMRKNRRTCVRVGVERYVWML